MGKNKYSAKVMAEEMMGKNTVNTVLTFPYFIAQQFPCIKPLLAHKKQLLEIGRKDNWSMSRVK